MIGRREFANLQIRHIRLRVSQGYLARYESDRIRNRNLSPVVHAAQLDGSISVQHLKRSDLSATPLPQQKPLSDLVHGDAQRSRHRSMPATPAVAPAPWTIVHDPVLTSSMADTLP